MINNSLIQQYCLYLNKATTLENWRTIKWMNKQAAAGEAYSPTAAEHAANVLTHGACVLPSVLGTCALVARARTAAQTLSALVYGPTLVFLFGVSAAFHCSCWGGGAGRARSALHRCDRAMIYVFIAGSYFPWLTLEPLPAHGWAGSVRWLVWAMAALGVLYQQTFHERYKRLETVFYLVMGIVPGLVLFREHDISGINELQLGGALYVIGVMFFKCDGVIPFAHAIWHLFVVLAAGVHYFAILNHLFPLKNDSFNNNQT